MTTEFETIFPDNDEDDEVEKPTTPFQLLWLMSNRNRLPAVLWEDFSNLVGLDTVPGDKEILEHCFVGGMLATLDVLHRLANADPAIIQTILTDMHNATAEREKEIVMNDESNEESKPPLH